MIKCFNVALIFSFVSALIISQPVYSQSITITDQNCFVSLPDGTTRPLTEEELNRGSVQIRRGGLFEGNGSIFSVGIISTTIDKSMQDYCLLLKQQNELIRKQEE